MSLVTRKAAAAVSRDALVRRLEEVVRTWRDHSGEGLPGAKGRKEADAPSQ